MSKNIVIKGCYGKGNLGDEAILTAFIKMAEKNKARINVFSLKPDNIERDYGIKSTSIKRKNTLGQIISILKCDIFILGGGGLLTDDSLKPSSTVKTWLYLFRFANMMRKKTIIWAIGVENIRNKKSKNLIKKSIQRADYISTRDHDSKRIIENIVKNIKINVVADPALLLGRVYQIDHGCKKSGIIVCLRDKMPFEKMKGNSFKIETAKALDEIINARKEKIVFVPFRCIANDDDKVFAESVVHFMHNKENVNILNEVPTTREYLQMAAKSKLVVGMRLHAVILASAVYTPTVGICVYPKVKYFMKSIKQEDYCMSLEGYKSEELINRIDKSYLNHEERVVEIKSVVQRMQALIVEEHDTVLA